MFQRLQDAMFDISSSQQHQQQHQQQLAPKSPIRPVHENSVDGGQVEELFAKKSELAKSCANEGSSDNLPLISCHVLGKQQQQPQHSQNLHSIHHPMMPFLLEKVRAAACIQSKAYETKEQQHQQQQRQRAKPKERFKGPHSQPAFFALVATSAPFHPCDS
jgi:hypothetical protein